jgi:DNA-binding NtrC family response regulator
MQRHLDVLVASPRMENQRALIQILNGLPINVVSSSTLKQTEQLLSQQPIALVFCDENLPDGSYRDLLSARPAEQKTPPVVITTRVGDWEDYLEATRLGAYDMIRCPLQTNDVQSIVTRAIRDGQRAVAAGA